MRGGRVAAVSLLPSLLVLRVFKPRVVINQLPPVATLKFAYLETKVQQAQILPVLHVPHLADRRVAW